MSYLIRYNHPETHELIMYQQSERPFPILKVPMYPRGIFDEPEDISRTVFTVAVYECQVIYRTPSGEPIYDYWRVR